MSAQQGSVVPVAVRIKSAVAEVQAETLAARGSRLVAALSLQSDCAGSAVDSTLSPVMHDAADGGSSTPTRLEMDTVLNSLGTPSLGSLRAALESGYNRPLRTPR